MPKHAIEIALLGATGLKKKEGEDRQKYLARLIQTVQDLPDKEWGKLDDEAQDWINTGAARVNKKKSIPDFPAPEAADDDDDDEPEEKPKRVRPAAPVADDDDDDDEEEEKPRKKPKAPADDDDDDDDDDEPEEKPRKKSKVAVAADDDDDDDAAEEKPKREKDPDAKKGGVGFIIKTACTNPAWSKEKVAKKVAAAGYDVAPATINIQYSTAHRVMKALHAAGHLENYTSED